LGYAYLNLDDCWQSSHRDANSEIQPDAERFPSGIKALSDYVHSKGLKFGIYSSAGFKTCQGYPASLGLEEIDANLYKEWEVDYLKYDNCYQDHGLPQHRYSAMANALEATGRDIFYSLCEWGRENPAAWAGELGGNSWRVSGDITDSWNSIISRAEYSASLWRYAGPSKGWNDPDMLEIGNGHCSLDEYRTHFSLWAMLKAPLIIGNDIRTLSPEDDIFKILSNKEVIAVSQDSLGLQGRIVWSDISNTILPSKGYGHRLIATKCSSGQAGAYEDSLQDQQWEYNSQDGTIRSTSTGQCLHEFPAFFDQEVSSVQSFGNFSVGLRPVTTKDCSEATKWDVEQGIGGSIVSRSSKLCLEVTKLEYLPITQGKRIQTAPCQDLSRNHYAMDVREHQSWTSPNHLLKNLYQRQCLTLDRDAYPGFKEEVWLGPLADGAYTVLIINKSRITNRFALSLDMLPGLTGRYQVRDLWEHRDLTERLTPNLAVNFMINSHASVLLKLTPM
jgi:hypothetical protein